MFYCVISRQANLIQGGPKLYPALLPISFNTISKQKLYVNQKYKRDMIITTFKP
jgi:hypothetical protein